MDDNRANNAVDAFRSAEVALTELIENANELTNSASSLREADEDVRTLAEALGIAAKQWADISVSMKDVSAEIQAAARLLQKAEPQELHEAVNENTTSISELRAAITTVHESVTEVDERTSVLVTRVESIAETSTNLRDAMVAKIDLLQSSTTQVQDDLKRSASAAESGQEKTRTEISESATPRQKTAARKEADKTRKILIELADYERDALYPLAAQQINIDLDDGVKVNYGKFGDLLAEVKSITGKKPEMMA